MFGKGNETQKRKERKQERIKAKAQKKPKKPKVSKHACHPDDHIEELAVKNFQKFCRLRDAYNGGYCISCGKYLVWNDNCDGGHYIKRKNKTVKFDEDNCHAQCVSCNQWRSGNDAEYRKNLIKKIGLEKVEYLESQKGVLLKEPRKRFHFIALNEYYLKKCRDIMKGK